MSRIVHVTREFPSRAQAEAWFERLRHTAWPYVWCIEDAPARAWRVVALVERGRTPVA